MSGGPGASSGASPSDTDLAAAFALLWNAEGLRGLFAENWAEYAGALPPRLRHLTGADAAAYVSRALASYHERVQ